jgi:hypothetical protein
MLRAGVDAVRDNPAGAESCSVLSGGVVAMERVSVLKSFNSIRNPYTCGVKRKSGFAEKWKGINRISGAGWFTQKQKSANVVFSQKTGSE